MATTKTKLTIDKAHARRFLLAHHHLAPPRKLKGKAGVMEYVRYVNCIQYDPINVVGGNPHLVLQSRIQGYKPAMLEELLYKDRQLVDGFDKVMSIYPTEDWAYFKGYRQRMGKAYIGHQSTASAAALMKWVRNEIKRRGPLSSLDLENDTRMQWWWGAKARSVRIALDLLFISGQVVVDHRVGTRRFFELTERALPAKLAGAKNPHSNHKAYLRWHILRRIGGLGLAHPAGNGEHWGGVQRTGSEKTLAVRELEASGAIVRVGIEGQKPSNDYFIRKQDLPALEAAAEPWRGKPGAAFLAPLDNVMWHRDRLEMLFDFFYRWEVYTPEAKRVYGYYVLPVLFGDQLVARMDPAFDRATKTFTIKSWWWQPGVNKKDPALRAALVDCVTAFAAYLNASAVVMAGSSMSDPLLRKVFSDL